MECKHCKSTNVVCICHHNNRRKKVPIYVYQCKDCKKRFTVEGDSFHYNHKGNLLQRKHICHHCGKYIEPDNDTERILGVHLDCFVEKHEEWNLEKLWGTAQDWFADLLEV